ncbi:MAG: helix-turn-helix domain-containing protein [Gemmatimonadales bacterium]
MAPLRIRLGQTVRELRAAAGFSQEAFAAEIKVHRTFMGSIERGKTNASLETLERLASGLGLDVWELLQKAEGAVSSASEQSSREATRKRKPQYGRRNRREE